MYTLIEILNQYKAFLSYLSYCQDIPEYNSKNIFDFVELLLKESNKLKIKFILVLDQYKSFFNEEEKLNNILKKFNTYKIIICSSIDDHRIRSAIIHRNPYNIIFQDKIISLEDIKMVYKDLFNNLSYKKIKALNLFQYNAREIFDCLNEKDENLNNYINKKIEKIKNYFMSFCGLNFQKISACIFIFNNIDYYLNELDFKEIIELIPFKYFTFEKIHKSSEIFNSNNFNLGIYKEENIQHKESEEKGKILLKNSIKENANYYKINFSMKIVDFSLYQFINEQDSILFFEQYIQKNEKESIKGIQFKEHIKSKLRKGKIIPIKDMRIAQSIEIWSFFENISNSYIPCLFEGKLEDNKIYFVTSRNQKDIFDCAFINLIKKEIIFIKITTNEEINNEVFNRKKLKKKIKKAIKFLTGKIIEENIKLNVGFCFIFLKYIINNNNEQEYMNDANKKILDKMISINEN